MTINQQRELHRFNSHQPHRVSDPGDTFRLIHDFRDAGVVVALVIMFIVAQLIVCL